jgi:hypothetical protein
MGTDLPIKESLNTTLRVLSTPSAAVLFLRIAPGARDAELEGQQRKKIRNQLEGMKNEALLLDQQRDEMVKKFGVSPDTSPLALTVFCTSLLQHREARAAEDFANMEITELQEKRTKQL